MPLLELKKQQVTDNVFLANASCEVGEGTVSTPIYEWLGVVIHASNPIIQEAGGSLSLSLAWSTK